MYCKKRGQILMEAVFLVLFSFVFLAVLAHLYEKGKKEIELSRYFSIKQNNTFELKKIKPLKAGK